MQMPLPFSNSYEFIPAHQNFVTTTSSSRSSSPPSPSPPLTGVFDQALGVHHPYSIQFGYDAHMHQFIPQGKPSFMHPNDLYSTNPYMSETEYQCIAPPDLHLTPLPSQSSSQIHAEYQSFFPPTLEDQMLPEPSQIPSLELPKRKGERALARLHRSAIDPARNWPCNQCIQKFARKSDLTRHLKRHAGRKDYPCTAPSCPLPIKDRLFYRADARRRHWNKSPICEKEFYKTPEGAAWTRKNGNRRGLITPSHGEDDNEDYGDNTDEENSVYDVPAGF